MHGVEKRAYAGIEMALWDILGQALGLPLYKLLGGAVRERALFSSYAFAIDETEGHTESDTPGLMAALAREQQTEMNAAVFEFKVARHSVGCDIETVQEIRLALGPAVAIGVDANMRYSVDQARTFLRKTAPAGLDNVEEPCALLGDCERLRRDFGVPVSTHCTDFDALRFFPLIDGVVGAVDQQGGIEAIMTLGYIARSHDRRFWMRSCIELGVAWAAMTHLGMAAQSLDRPSQGLIHWIEDDLIEGPVWAIRDGGVQAPDRPGLGVVLDEDAFRRAAERCASQT
jgi:L-alanine-DL-glutamate epimerase-like enolase superfamily enzyme